MQVSAKQFGVIAFIIAVPIIGTALMYLFTYVLPLAEGEAGTAIVYTLVLTLMGLVIPYAMVKAVFREASLTNPDEKQFKLSDIAKDKDQLALRMSSKKRNVA